MIVIRKRASAKENPYSGEAEGLDWDNPDTQPMEAVFAPDSAWSREIVGPGRVSLRFAGTLIFTGEASVDIRADDRVEVNGRTYRANGEPVEWISPFDGTIGGSNVALEVTE